MADSASPDNSREHLWKHSKIVTRVVDNGNVILQLDKKNLGKIVQSVDPSLSEGPVALVAVTGPKGSGKSFYTNLLIHYLKHNGSGGWLTKLTNKKKREELCGFQYGNVVLSSGLNLIPDEVSSGIYLWPEPFQVDQPNGEKLLVWVLHLHHVKKSADEGGEEMDSLEVLLNLMCSTVVEIGWNSDGFKTPDIREKLLDWKATLFTDLPNIVYLTRSKTSKMKNTDEICIVESSKALHNGSGYLEIGLDKKMYFQLEKCIQGIGDEVSPKSLKDGKQLTLIKMKRHIINCVTFIRMANDEARTKDEETRNSKCLNNSAVNATADSKEENMDTNVKCLGDTFEVEKEESNEVEINTNGECQNSSLQNCRPLPSSDKVNTSSQGEGEFKGEQSNEKMNVDMNSTKWGENVENGVVAGSPVDDWEMLDADGRETLKEVENKPFTSGLYPDVVFWLADAIDEGQSGGKMVKEASNSSNRKLMSRRKQTNVYNLRRRPAENPSCNGDGKDVRMLDDGDNQNHLVRSKDQHKNKTEASTNSRDGNENEEARLKEMERQQREQEEEKRRRDEEEERKRQQEMEEKLKRRREKEEKERKEMEEKQRQEEETKRLRLIMEEKEKAYMSNLVTEKYIEFKEIINSQFNEWLTKTLTPFTIDDCKKIYSRNVQHILRTAGEQIPLHKVRPSFQSKFQKELLNKVEQYKEPFESIYCGINNFHVEVNKKFEKFGCLTKEKLEETMEKALTNTLASMDEGNKKTYVTTGCARLAQYYRDHNEAVTKSETQLAEETAVKLRQIYNDEMVRILEKHPYNPMTLNEIHVDLVKVCLNELRTVMSIITGSTDNICVSGALVQALQEKVNKDFKTVHRATNQRKLESLQKQITELIKQCKNQYEENMDSAMRRCPDGIDLKVLQSTHEGAAREVIKILQIEIRNKIGPAEPVEVHQKTLLTHLDKAWRGFYEENADKLKSRSPPNVKNSKELETNQTFKEDKSPDNLLPALLFHLSLSKISMCKMVFVNGEFQRVPCKTKDQFIPAVVGLTHNNLWLSGTDVTERMKNSDEEFVKSWRIGQFFNSGRTDGTIWYDKVQIGDTWHKITVEFLLGLLLHNLKESVENQFNGKADEAVIIVPFWFPSSHRVQVKLGAKIAGFNKILLLNENSTAAFELAYRREGVSPDRDVLVLSENSGNVDITLFSFETVWKRLKMRSHFGHYPGHKEEGEEGGAGWLQAIKDYGWYTLGFTEKREEDEVTKGVLDAWLEMEKELRKIGCNSCREIIVICESDKWKPVLHHVASKISAVKIITYHIENLMLGAHVLSCKNMSKIGEIIKDMIPCDVLKLHPPYSTFTRVQSKKEFYLPEDKKQISTSFANKALEALFYQNMFNSSTIRVPIGHLLLTKGRPAGFEVETNFEINNEGIVKLKGVRFKKFTYWSKDAIDAVQGTDYEWIRPFPDLQEVAVFASLIESLKQLKVEEGEKGQVRNELLQKGNDLTQRMENGEGNFRSNLGRNMVKKQITEAMDLAKHPNCSREDILKQMELFKGLEQKYFPQ